VLCYGAVAGGLLSDRWIGAPEPAEWSTPIDATTRSLTKYILIARGESVCQPDDARYKSAGGTCLDMAWNSLTNVMCVFCLGALHCTALHCTALHCRVRQLGAGAGAAAVLAWGCHSARQRHHSRPGGSGMDAPAACCHILHRRAPERLGCQWERRAAAVARAVGGCADQADGDGVERHRCDPSAGE